MILINEKKFILLQATQRFFTKELGDHLSHYDCLDLMNLWFFLIATSDSCAIIGSLMKMLIDVNVTKFLSCCVLDKRF